MAFKGIGPYDILIASLSLRNKSQKSRLGFLLLAQTKSQKSDLVLSQRSVTIRSYQS